MKPVTGRPKNVAGAPATVVLVMPPMLVRSDTTEPMPSVVAPLPVKVRAPQPFWNVEVTFTCVTLTEPSTPEVGGVVAAGMCAAPLRIDSTFDSQQMEFGEPE